MLVYTNTDAILSLCQLGSSPSSDDLAGTASDLDSGVGAHASADSSDSAAAIVMATGEGLEDASSEVLHVVSPDQLLQVSTGEEQAVPVQVCEIHGMSLYSGGVH